MLSNGFDVPLRLTLKASKILIRFQLSVHLLAIVALGLPSNIPLVVRIFFFIFVIASAAIMQRKYRHRKSCDELFVWQKKALWVEYLAGKEICWLCQPGNLVTPWFVVVRLCNKEQKCPLLIFWDQCDAQSFRRLRVKLKYFQGEVAMPTGAS